MHEQEGVAGRPRSFAGMHHSTASLLVAFFGAVLLGSVMLLVPLPFAAVTSGPTVDTLSDHDGTPLITVSGATTYPTQGSLDLTTVRIYGGPQSRVTPWQLVSSWLDRTRTVLPEQVLFPPGQSAAEATRENELEMASSQQSATAAALRTLGHQVGEEVRVAGFTDGSPSEGTLREGDVILSVRGTATPDGETLRTALQAAPAGQPVDLVVRRAAKQVPLSPKTVRSPSGATVLGVLVEPVFVFPFQVKIQIDNVGGPSAGTMFALGIIDKLTPGALTGGKVVAGTGTMDPEGQVGPIGFIQQKMYGAKASGAAYFLAPRDNCDEVVGHEPDGLSVVAVSTLAQARDAVQKISSGAPAGDLPRCG